MSRRLVAGLAALLAVLVAVDSLTLIYAVAEGPFPSVVPRGAPTAYRNLYIHVPVSIAAYLAFTISALAGLSYLALRRDRHYVVMETSIRVGLPLGVASFLTGSIWAHESWGAFWSWDPRQVGVLFLVIAYSLYFVVKRAVEDPDRSPLISSGYAVAAYATVPLSFILPYITESLHPTIEQTRPFAESVPLFRFRILVLSLEVALLIYLLALKVAPKSLLKASGYALLLASLASASIITLPLAVGEGELARVLEAEEAEGGLLLTMSINGVKVKGLYSGPSPVEPPIVVFKDESYYTIVGNLVLVEVDEEGTINGLNVVVHPVVAANALVYGAAMVLIYLSAYRWRWAPSA